MSTGMNDSPPPPPGSSAPGGRDAAALPRGIGLALGSGMARGFAHIGVLRALTRNGIYPGIVTGSSIGSLVGGCYLAGKLEDLADWATSLSRFKLFSYLDFKVRSPGLIGGTKLWATLRSHFSDMMIEDLPLPFVAVATDLLTGHEVWLRKGDLVDSMRASFALPGVFAPVSLNGRHLVDGALVNPVPVSACAAFGARMTIAVDLNADMIGKAVRPGQPYQTVAGFDVFNDRDVPPLEQKLFSAHSLTARIFRRDPSAPSLFGVMVSSLNIIQDRTTRSRLAGDPPDIHIRPQVGHLGVLEFERAKEMIAKGEEAGEAALPEIRAAMQVLLPAHSNAFTPPGGSEIPNQY